MTKQLVGIGSSANDGTGDTLRDGAIKYNANFDELYERLGNTTEILIDIGAGITEGQVLQWSTTPTPAFRGADYNLLTGNLDWVSAGRLVPALRQRNPTGSCPFS